MWRLADGDATVETERGVWQARPRLLKRYVAFGKQGIADTLCVANVLIGLTLLMAVLVEESSEAEGTVMHSRLADWWIAEFAQRRQRQLRMHSS